MANSIRDRIVRLNSAQSTIKHSSGVHKDVSLVIDTVERVNIARPVAKMLPLLTVKG